MNERPEGVFMLGMHRSGTSAATRVINLLGAATCVAGDTARGPWNPTGLWESRTLNHLDDKLLEEMGRSWFWPPPSGAGYEELSARITTRPEEARRVFDEVHPSRPWVWKDPCTCLLLPFWRAAIGGRQPVILVVRNPLEVADSLKRRHEVDLDYGLALRGRYNRLALVHAAGLPRLVSRYEELIEDPARWSARARTFLEQAGLELAPGAAEGDLAEFIDEGRRHNVRSRAELEAAAPSAVPVLDALDSLVGAHENLAPPEPAPEPEHVESSIARVASKGGLGWADPPWQQDAKTCLASAAGLACAPPRRPPGTLSANAPRQTADRLWAAPPRPRRRAGGRAAGTSPAAMRCFTCAPAFPR